MKKESINISRETSIKWFHSFDEDEQTDLCIKYNDICKLHGRLASSLTGREIEEIFRKENPNLITSAEQLDEIMDDIFSKPIEEYDYQKWYMNPNPSLPNWMNGKKNETPSKIESDVFNLKNEATFSVEELKDFSEEFAVQCQNKSKGIVMGFWDLCKVKFYHKFQQSKQTEKFSSDSFKDSIEDFSDEDKIIAHQILWKSLDFKTQNKILEAICN